MKNLEEIKEGVAIKHGFKNWFSLTNHCWQNLQFKRLHDCEDEVAEEYAKQCCDEQIKACAEKAQDEATSSYAGEIIVEVDSILNTPNVVTKK